MGDEEFLSYLAEKQNPLPDYYIDILRGLAGDISYKTILKSQLSTYKRNMAQAINIIVRNELNDSICNIDTVRNWLGAMTSPSSICQIIDSYLQEGNATDAQSSLNSISVTYDIAPEDSAEFNRYISLKQLQINLINQGRNVFLLDSTEKQLLISISDNSNGIAGAQASNILEFVYSDHFCNCPEIPDSVTHKAYESPSIRPPASSEIELQVFPNPAKSWTAFEYKLPYNDGDVSIIIYNSSGQIENTLPITDSQGQVIWDVRDSNPGVYFYILKLNNEQKSGNLIIVK